MLAYDIGSCLIPSQGSYRSWKTWKVMEFDNLDSRPGKSWNFGPGPGKSWNFMLANLYAAELPTVLDCLTCMREKTLNYGNMYIYWDSVEDFRDRAIPYSETVLSPLRFNINCT